MEIKKKNKIILIFSTQRSGSTMVTSDFSQTDILGKPSEYFTEKILPGSKFSNCSLSIEEIQNEIQNIIAKARTANGIVSVKIMSDYIVEIAKAIAKVRGVMPPDYFSDLERKSYLQKLFINFFNDLDIDGEFIAFRVYRKNKVKQAISRFVAAKTGLYHVWKNDQGQLVNHYDRPAAKATPFSLDLDKHYSHNKISSIIDSIYHEERELDILFENFQISPTNLVYENLIKNTSYLESIVKKISYLDSSATVVDVPRKTIKTASNINTELLKKFNDGEGYNGKIKHVSSEQYDVIKHIYALPKSVIINESCLRNKDIIDLTIDPPYLKPNDNDCLVIEGVIISSKKISNIFVYFPISDKNYEAIIELNSEYFGFVYWGVGNSQNARFRCLIPLISQNIKKDQPLCLELNYQIEKSSPSKLVQVDISHFVDTVRAKL